MREILFRGKRLDCGVWVYGNLVIMDSTWIYLKTFRNPLFKIDFGATDWMVVRYEVDENTIGQYTGLKDKNGIKIYDGDIVKQHYVKTGPYPHDELWEGHHIGVVRITASKGVCLRNPINYDEIDDVSSVSNIYKNVSGYRAEVIGNIHDNPELLGESHE